MTRCHTDRRYDGKEAAVVKAYLTGSCSSLLPPYVALKQIWERKPGNKYEDQMSGEQVCAWRHGQKLCEHPLWIAHVVVDPSVRRSSTKTTSSYTRKVSTRQRSNSGPYRTKRMRKQLLPSGSGLQSSSSMLESTFKAVTYFTRLQEPDILT